MKEGKIAEVFKGIQGEGIYVGAPQIFLRFFGCNLSCKFCDTRLNSYSKYSSLELIAKIRQIKGPVQSLCITGGEPLCQAAFLKNFLPLVKNKGIKVYLETNATLPKQLNRIINYIDIIAMDIKLPSSTGCGSFWKLHESFLDISKTKCIFVKVVICKATKSADLKKAARLVSNASAGIKFVLQPEYRQLDKFLINKLKEFQNICFDYLQDIRIIPQVHKLIGLR